MPQQSRLVYQSQVDQRLRDIVFNHNNAPELRAGTIAEMTEGNVCDAGNTYGRQRGRRHDAYLPA